MTGQEETEAITTPEYWVSHVLQTVRFANAMMSLASLSSDQGPEAYLEIGPEPTLVKMGRRCVNALPKAPGMSKLLGLFFVRCTSEYVP